MIRTVPGLNYKHLASALKMQGFSEVINAEGRIYEHPTGALLLLPPVDEEEPLRAHHFAAARAALDDYAILPRDAFDILMMRVSQQGVVTV